MSDEVWMRAVSATHRHVALALAASWPLPVGTLRALEQADGIQVRDGRSDGNIVRFAVALADQQGYFLRRGDVETAEIVRGQGRMALGLDERSEAKLLAGFAGKVSIVAPVRGA
jgi:hypothetical protein